MSEEQDLPKKAKQPTVTERVNNLESKLDGYIEAQEQVQAQNTETLSSMNDSLRLLLEGMSAKNTPSGVPDGAMGADESEMFDLDTVNSYMDNQGVYTTDTNAPEEIVTDVTKIMDNDQLHRFMNEEVEVMFHQAEGSTLSPVNVPIAVNGVIKVITRDGKPQKIQRKYVELLARSGPIKYKQYTRPPTPNLNVAYEDTTVTVGSKALRLPFVVLNDTAEGKAWFKQIISSP